MKTNPSQNENENLFVNIDNLDAPSNLQEVYVPKSNNVEDEEDLPSLDRSLDSDDLMNIVSREKKIHKDNYEDLFDTSLILLINNKPIGLWPLTVCQNSNSKY